MKAYIHKVSILYVEDENDVREGYSRALKRISSELLTAVNGEEGLALYKEHHSDIIVSDIKMPKMNGIDMVKEIQKINPDISVIFTSAHSESAYLLEAIELQVDGYLLKPVDKKSLTTMVEKLSKNILLENENRLLRKELSKKAYIDNLTQIYNRNKFEEVFEYQIKQVKRYKHSLSLAIFDIDNFKKFNDTYGHLMGDEVLFLLSQTVLKNSRESDLLARWGGEEFVILFTNTNIDDALNLCEKYRKKIQEIQHSNGEVVTVSFGVTEFKKDDSLNSMLQRSDEALYIAKAAGRNQVRSII